MPTNSIERLKPSARTFTLVGAGISALALSVLGACRTVAPPPAPAAKPTATATATATATTTVVGAKTDTKTETKTASAKTASAKPAPVKRTPELRAKPVTAAGKGTIIPGAVNVYTFDPEPDFTPVDASKTSISHVLADLGSDATEWFQHVETLSNPWFEGRAPGSEGSENAAKYVQWWMQKAGLEPAFAEGSQANAENPWRQPFDLPGGERKLKSSVLTLGNTAYESKDARAMRNTGGGMAEMPVAFVGYGIVDGKDGYTSFGKDERFDGRIVMVMRGEPLTAEGKSLWGGEKFTGASSLAAKLDAIKARGAAGIIVTEAPGYAGKKTDITAMSAESLGGALSIPCFFAETATADAIVKACDPEGRDLAALRAIADAGTKDKPATTVLGKDTAPVKLNVDISNGQIVAYNIGGVLKGKGALANEWIVIGAHYDHVGYGKYGADPANKGKVHPGADDNASGTSGMLVMARRIAKEYADAGADANLRSVLFLAFSAEEVGLNGSRAFIKAPSIPADKLDVMLNMDMIGRMRGGEIAIGGVESAKGFSEALAPMFIESGLKVHADPSGRGPSDHASFYGAGIPVLFFFSGVHDVYHKPGDQGYSVDPRGVTQVFDLVGRIAMWRAGAKERLEFSNGVQQANANGGPAPGDRGYAPVRLGIQPGSTEDGESGIKVDSVTDGTSAAEAGIKAGDILLSWNGDSLDSTATMMTKLRASKPGDVAKIKIMRGQQAMEIDVKLKASTAARRPQND